MNAQDARIAIQQILGTTPDGIIKPGGQTETALKLLAALPSAAAWPPSPPATGRILRGDGTWPFTARIEDEDIVCEDIVITCFGGANDPQDSGATASGISTKANPNIEGVSIAMDGRQFGRLSPAEHRALDGSPFPRMPWGTKVIITVEGRQFAPGAGIIDLGPGKQASKGPHDPHALDVTVAVAARIRPAIPRHKLSTQFSARGSFRILGGAKYVLEA